MDRYFQNFWQLGHNLYSTKLFAPSPFHDFNNTILSLDTALSNRIFSVDRNILYLHGPV